MGLLFTGPPCTDAHITGTQQPVISASQDRATSPDLEVTTRKASSHWLCMTLAPVRKIHSELNGRSDSRVPARMCSQRKARQVIATEATPRLDGSDAPHASFRSSADNGRRRHNQCSQVSGLDEVA